VDQDLALLYDDLGLEHGVNAIAFHWVAVEQDDVGQLAGLERSDLIGYADEPRRVGPMILKMSAAEKTMLNDFSSCSSTTTLRL
jgi:hypothetical protein